MLRRARFPSSASASRRACAPTVSSGPAELDDRGDGAVPGPVPPQCTAARQRFGRTGRVAPQRVRRAILATRDPRSPLALRVARGCLGPTAASCRESSNDAKIGEAATRTAQRRPALLAAQDGAHKLLFRRPVERAEASHAWDGVRNYQARNFLRDDMRVGRAGAHLSLRARIRPGSPASRASRTRRGPDATQFDPKDEHFDPKARARGADLVQIEVEAVQAVTPCRDARRAEGRPASGAHVGLQRGQRLSVQPVQSGEWRAVLELAGLTCGRFRAERTCIARARPENGGRVARPTTLMDSDLSNSLGSPGASGAADCPACPSPWKVPTLDPAGLTAQMDASQRASPHRAGGPFPHPREHPARSPSGTQERRQMSQNLRSPGRCRATPPARTSKRPRRQQGRDRRACASR